MFSVPYNQDIEILNIYEKYKDNISEVYFSGDPSIIHSARKMNWNEDCDKDLDTLLKFLDDNNIISNIVMNSINDDNLFTIEGLSLIVNYLNSLYKKGLKCVTISNPILFKAIKENIPELKIGLSITSNIYYISQIEQYYEYGLYEICLPPYLSRDKDYILKIKECFPDLKIKMMANCFCRPDCIAFVQHHIEVSRGNYENDEKYFEYVCTQNEFNPLKKNFILPNEIEHYDYIDIFKISGRQSSTSNIQFVLEKYVNGINYGYNLIDLLDGPKNSVLINTSYLNDVRNVNKINNCKYKCKENNCNYCDKILEKYFDFYQK